MFRELLLGMRPLSPLNKGELNQSSMSTSILIRRLTCTGKGKMQLGAAVTCFISCLLMSQQAGAQTTSAATVAAIKKLEAQTGGRLVAYDPPREIVAPQGFGILAAPVRKARQVNTVAGPTTLRAVAVLRLDSEEYYITDYSWDLLIKGKAPNWVLLPSPATTAAAAPSTAPLPAGIPMAGLGGHGAGSNSGVGRPNLVVLIVANKNYSAHNAAIAKSFDLPNTHNDAELLARTFRAIGADVIVVEDTRRDEMSQAVQKVLTSLEKDDAFFFHYSGHGFQVGGENYLLPVGVDAKDADRLLTSCFGLSELFAQITKAQPRLSAVILDCCRNNPFENTAVPSSPGQGKTLGSSPSGQRSVSSGLAEASAPANMLIAYATSPGKVALDSMREGDTCSPFASSLAHAIQEGPMEIRQLLAKVGRLTKDNTNGFQTPWLTSDAFAEFYPHYPQRQISMPDADLQLAGRLMRKSATLLEGMGVLSRSLKRQPKMNLAAPALAFALCYQSIPVPLRRIVNTDLHDVYKFESNILLRPRGDGWPICLPTEQSVRNQHVELYDRDNLKVALTKDGQISSYLKKERGHIEAILFPDLPTRNNRLTAHLNGWNRLWDVEYYKPGLSSGGNHQINERYLTGPVAFDEQFLVFSHQGILESPKSAVSLTGVAWHFQDEEVDFPLVWKVYMNGREVPRGPSKHQNFSNLAWGAFRSADRLVVSYDSLEILDMKTGESKGKYSYPFGKDRRIFWPGYNEKYQRLHGIMAWGEGVSSGIPIIVDLVTGKMVSSEGSEVEKSGISYKAGGDGEYFVQYDWLGTPYFSDSLTGGRVLDIPATSASLADDEFVFSSANEVKESGVKYRDLPVERIRTSPPLFQFETEWYASPHWLTMLSDALTGFYVDDLGQLKWHEDAAANLAAALHEMRTQTGNRAYQALAGWLMEHKLRQFQEVLRQELNERLPKALSGNLGPDNYDRGLYIADALAKLSVYVFGGDADEVRSKMSTLHKAGDFAGLEREARRIATAFPR